jgi:Holliday junction resolvase RusA-like endonuclease
MWSEPVEFTIPGEPVPKGRPIASARRVGRRTVITLRTPDATREYEAKVARHAPRVAVPGRGIYWVSAVFIVRDRPKTKPSQTPAEAWAEADPFHVGQTDADNHAKALLDGLQGWMGNDSRVVKLDIEKRCGDRPRVDVVVRWWAA